MISLGHKYEDFGSLTEFPDAEAHQNASNYNSEKLQSFEDGYQAGWEDSTKAQNEFEKKMSSNLSQNLQDISFGFHEARNTLTQGMKPLFEEILNKLLPEISKSSIGSHILEQLGGMVRENSDQAIEIIVSPSEIEALQSLLQDQISDPFVLLAQPDLNEGQVYIRLGSHEREINLKEMVQRIRSSTHNIFEQEQANG